MLAKIGISTQMGPARVRPFPLHNFVYFDGLIPG